MAKPAISKKQVFENLKKEVDLQLSLAVEAVQNSLSAATHEESKPENKYDTRGLEASYLARAQSERVLDLKELSQVTNAIKYREFAPEDPIAISALIEIENDGKNQWLLLLPKGGGQSVSVNNSLIKVITPESPLGAQLLGKSVGDCVSVRDLEYEILKVV